LGFNFADFVKRGNLKKRRVLCRRDEEKSNILNRKYTDSSGGNPSVARAYIK
jgi:hypothetical protein